ncbi:hypothetical protein [Rhizobium leguminosarum]|uniref:hypothetical protein n=1 Tax=Rhizobium leguminosarum TaxID=384 RepID=UPI001FEDEB91|nr:hypothetical protein [Rhizobium leguminosarum]
MKIDKASYRNRGGLIQRITTAYKRFRYFTAAGNDLVVKRSAEFRMVSTLSSKSALASQYRTKRSFN